MNAIKKICCLILITSFISLPRITSAQVDADSARLEELYSDERTDIEDFSLEELLDVEIAIASLFAEDELVTGSTVSCITAKEWKQLGARRFHEALNNEMSVQTTSNIGGMYNIAIRGYTNTESREGVAAIIDGIPTSEITVGTAFMAMPNCELGILDRIELIKGPGSAIYGADAFHGVLSMKTFESDNDYYSIEGAGAFPLYGDANVKVSQGIADDIIRIDTAFSTSYQDDQELEYKYEDEDGQTKTSEYSNSFKSRSGVFKIRINPVDKLKAGFGAYMTYYNGEKYPGIGKASGARPLDKDYTDAETTYYIGNGKLTYKLPCSISMEALGYYKRSRNELYIISAPTTGLLQEATADHYGWQVCIKQPDNPINLQWFAAYSYVFGEVKEFEKYLMVNLSEKSKMSNESAGYSVGIHSVFSQIKWGAVKERLYLLLGGRVDNYSMWGNQVCPRGGIIFLPTRKSSIKALYGRAYKAPTQVHINGIYPYIEGNENIEPEKMDVYELIYMYKKHDFKFSVSGFYNQWKDAITVLQRSGGYNIFINRGKKESMGGELNLFYNYNPFEFDIGFSYITSRAIDAQDPEDPADCSEEIKYSAFPEYSINAGIYYTLMPVEVTFYLNNRIFLNMKESHTDANNPYPDDLPPYYRLDLNISKIINDKAEFYLDIRNLLNRENRVPSVYGAKDGYLEPGISVMLRAGYKI